MKWLRAIVADLTRLAIAATDWADRALAAATDLGGDD